MWFTTITQTFVIVSYTVRGVQDAISAHIYVRASLRALYLTIGTFTSFVPDLRSVSSTATASFYRFTSDWYSNRRMPGLVTSSLSGSALNRADIPPCHTLHYLIASSSFWIRSCFSATVSVDFGASSVAPSIASRVAIIPSYCS